MPKYDVSVVVHFEADAINSTEAKARLMTMRLHKLLLPLGLMHGLKYTKKELVKVKKRS